MGYQKSGEILCSVSVDFLQILVVATSYHESAGQFNVEVLYLFAPPPFPFPLCERTSELFVPVSYVPKMLSKKPDIRHGVRMRMRHVSPFSQIITTYRYLLIELGIYLGWPAGCMHEHRSIDRTERLDRHFTLLLPVRCSRSSTTTTTLQPPPTISN